MFNWFTPVVRGKVAPGAHNKCAESDRGKRHGTSGCVWTGFVNLATRSDGAQGLQKARTGGDAPASASRNSDEWCGASCRRTARVRAASGVQLQIVPAMRKQNAVNHWTATSGMKSSGSGIFSSIAMRTRCGRHFHGTPLGAHLYMASRLTGRSLLAAIQSATAVAPPNASRKSA